jgi:hypothetical protein
MDAQPEPRHSFCPTCVRHGLIALSAIAVFVVMARARPRPGAGVTRLRTAGLTSALAAVVLAVRGAEARGERTACEDERDDGLRVCARYEDQGYAACSRYEDRGYSACSRYEDRGYSACSRYEDRGYNSCREWRKNCCDWWPCSWVCEVFSWFCFAWVWISHLVCVAWVWVSHLVCVAWVWITHLVCVAWIWITSRVCVLWWWIRFPLCTLICLLRRLFTGNEVSQSRSECIYSWTVRYLITEESDCRLNLVVRIRLQPDAGITPAQLQTAQTTWEPAIEQAWTGQFPLRRSTGHCACERYAVSLDVQWVTSGEHHVVQVHAGSGRADMGNFFLNSTGGTAAHEVGHMLGNPDEYADPACPNRNVTSDNSIMQTSQRGTVRPRHYQGFADWITARTCCGYAVAGD